MADHSKDHRGDRGARGAWFLLGVMIAAAVVMIAVVAGCGAEKPRRHRLEDAGAIVDGAGGRQGADARAGADGGAFGPAGCATATIPVELRPADMLLVVDTSGSMDFPDPDDPQGAALKWFAVRDAIVSFVSDPSSAGLGVGLQYFPLVPAVCQVDGYAQPAIPIGVLPIGKPNLVDSLRRRSRSGPVTPIVPVLEGTTSFLRSWVAAHPQRRPILVLATDGVPDTSCLNDRRAEGATGGLPNTLSNAVTVARAALEGTPSISTFVIGVGRELTALNEIAAAGGTGQAILVDTANNAEQSLREALSRIRRRAVLCELPIPSDRVTQLDFARVNVRLSSQGGSEAFGNVGNPTGCARSAAGGWYFDNPQAPTKVLLCEQACDRVQARVGGRLEVVVGCATIVY